MSKFDRDKTFGFSREEIDDIKDKFVKISKMLGSPTSSIIESEEEYSKWKLNGNINTETGLIENIDKSHYELRFNDALRMCGTDETATTSKEIIDNVDTKRRIIVPPFLMCFLHEVSHSLTFQNIDDIVDYQKQIEEIDTKYEDDEITEEEYFLLYRKISYEKLADNLGYELYIQNRVMINRILESRKVTKSKKRE